MRMSQKRQKTFVVFNARARWLVGSRTCNKQTFKNRLYYFIQKHFIYFIPSSFSNYKNNIVCLFVYYRSHDQIISLYTHLCEK